MPNFLSAFFCQIFSLIILSIYLENCNALLTHPFVLSMWSVLCTYVVACSINRLLLMLRNGKFGWLFLALCLGMKKNSFSKQRSGIGMNCCIF